MNDRLDVETSIFSTPSNYGVFEVISSNLAYAVPQNYNVWGSKPIYGPNNDIPEVRGLHNTADLLVNPSLGEDQIGFEPVAEGSQISYPMNMQSFGGQPRSYAGYLVFDESFDSVTVDGPPGIEELVLEELRVHPLPPEFAQPLDSGLENLEEFGRDSEMNYSTPNIIESEETEPEGYKEAGDGSSIPGGVPGEEWEEIVDTLDSTFEE